VPTTTIQPIGLLVNELVTNAAKHGAGLIEVDYSVRDELHTLSVCDAGEGLPEDFDVAEARTSLGMRVVTVLASQLGGELAAGPRNGASGACFTFSFVPMVQAGPGTLQ
jgi:two-component sensor histidine kinase